MTILQRNENFLLLEIWFKNSIFRFLEVSRFRGNYQSRIGWCIWANVAKAKVYNTIYRWFWLYNLNFFKQIWKIYYFPLIFPFRFRYNEIFFMIDTCQAASMYEKFYSPNILAVASSLVGEDSLSVMRNELTLEFF